MPGLDDFHNDLRKKGVGSRDWANSFTEVEYIGNGIFTASISLRHKVFKDVVDDQWKKHKLTDNRPDFVLIQSANCCVEVYPYYAKYFDVNHEEVRLYEERWVVERFQGKKWRDIGAWNPIISVEELLNSITVTVVYETDYGSLVIEYIQRDGKPLKHNVTFTNTSGGSETFRVIQKWAGIVGNKVKHHNNETEITIPTLIDDFFFEFLKDDGNISIIENQTTMHHTIDPLTGEYIPLTEGKLQVVEVDTHANGMKADFIFSSWILSQGESLHIDPDSTTIESPSQDTFIIENVPGNNYGTFDEMDIQSATTSGYGWRVLVEHDVSGIPPATVSEAELQVYFWGHVNETYDPDGRTVLAQRITESWDEDTVTWATKPGISTTDQDSRAHTGTHPSWFDYIIPEIVEDWLDGTHTNYGICLRFEDEVGGYARGDYRTKDYSTDYDAMLYIVYTPPVVAPTVTTQDATGIGFDP